MLLRFDLYPFFLPSTIVVGLLESVIAVFGSVVLAVVVVFSCFNPKGAVGASKKQ